MLIFSEGGDKDLMKKHFTPKEKNDFVLGKTHLCAYWIKPVHDDSGKKNIIGTTIRCDASSPCTSRPPDKNDVSSGGCHSYYYDASVDMYV